jgi:K+-transporting ATPase ATPase C chain
MWTQILPGLRIKLFLTLLLGIGYPLAMTGIAQLVFPHKANGSLFTAGNKVIGSELIGQNFTRPEYFHGRPSSAGSGYDATASSGSNLGPTSAKLLYGSTKLDGQKHEVVDFDGLSVRMVHYCLENELPYESSQPLDAFKDASGNLDDVKLIHAFNDPKSPFIFSAKAPVPADAITGSASGLDPEISPAFAQVQAPRVAKARGIPLDQVNRLVARFTETPDFGLFGEPRVNVFNLNRALDAASPHK